MKKTSLWVALALGACLLTGCAKEEAPEPTPAGTPQINEMPAGTTAPGDTRPNPAANDEARG
jgi:PBP1b-binding outer membrane lipoprotein LpoB